MFSTHNQIEVVRLIKWLDWAGGKVGEVFVALPMVQRGSVWQPHQIIDLWDSLLQGMPIGSMMVSELKQGTPVRRPDSRQHELIPAGGGLALIDGQQRTLAMLIAWPRAEEMDRRVWIDFADTPPAGQLLRLRVTTKNQPFGFQLTAPSRKLSLEDRRRALCAFEALHGKGEVPTLQSGSPFSHTPGLPVDLGILIELWLGRSSCEDWCSRVEGILRSLKGAKLANTDPKTWIKAPAWSDSVASEQVIKRVRALASALSRLIYLEMPLIRVDEHLFETKNTEITDPPLAVLFKRIGTGGTPLSDADYVYSVIKHLRPETYDLVEELHNGDKTVASLLTATDLVMTAVRLAAVDWEPEDGRPVPDMESPSKQDFHRLLQRGDFIGGRFLPLIQNDEQKPLIARYFSKTQAMLTYRAKGDIGLPKQVFPLLNRPLVQVLLLLAQAGYMEDANQVARREDILRLALFWLVAVTDAPKASHLAFDVIKHISDPGVELGHVIHDRLVLEGAAVRLPKPEEIVRLGLSISPEHVSIIQGESRFDPKVHNQEDHSGTYAFYRSHWWRPWTYQHPILLWLQRELVAEKFDKETDPMSGRDQDTPYDYDHILPYAHWGSWTGVRRGDSLLCFIDAQPQLHVIGNGIGNIRVWGSSLNKSDGSLSPTEKLELGADAKDEERNMLLKYSGIEIDQISKWKVASGLAGERRSWNRDRALAFQRAVEKCSFHLYQAYYNGLGFSEWQLT